MEIQREREKRKTITGERVDGEAQERCSLIVSCEPITIEAGYSLMAGREEGGGG